MTAAESTPSPASTFTLTVWYPARGCVLLHAPILATGTETQARRNSDTTTAVGSWAGDPRTARKPCTQTHKNPRAAGNFCKEENISDNGSCKQSSSVLCYLVARADFPQSPIC